MTGALGCQAFVIKRISREFTESRSLEFLEISKQVPGLCWTEQNLLMELPDKWVVSLVAIDNDGLISGYSINSIRDDSLYVHLLVVKGALRGEGIGSALLMHARDIARSHLVVHCIRLVTTISWTGAVSFYLRNGFSVKCELSETNQYILELAIQKPI